MSAFIKCDCPHCGEKIEFSNEDAGRICDCPHCGNALQLPAPVGKIVSPPVELPPKIVYVQAPQPQTIYVKEKPKTGCLTQIIAAFLILMLIGFIISLFDSASNSPTSSPSPQNKSHTAKAKIELFKDEGLIVSNMGTDTWDTITLYVDSDPPFGYSCTIGPVKHLESKVIPLRDFVKENGERFNADENKVVKVWIGGGSNGYDYESYGF
jgi:hypothetical protein